MRRPSKPADGGRVGVAVLLVALIAVSACGGTTSPERTAGSQAADSEPEPEPEPEPTVADGSTTAVTTGAAPHPTAAATSSASTGGAHGDRGSFYLAVADQHSDGRSLTVDEVTLTGTPGYIAVHSSVDHSLGPVIGSSAKLSPGTSRNVTAVLARPLVASVARVYVMVHRDVDGNDSFDYPGADGPAVLPDGTSVMVPVSLEIG